MKKAKDEGFVRRWSRLKSEARRTPAEAQDEVPQPPPASANAPGVRSKPEDTPAAGGVRGPEPGDTGVPARFDPASLPDIESLTFESDYTAFLQEGVPRELRNRALQRLWRSDPVLANLDGLLEYGEDYSAIGTKKTLVRTAYRVGRGMIDRALEPEKETREPEAPVAPGGEGEAASVRESPAAARPDEAERAEAEAETDEAPGPGPRPAQS
jgi:Protein of unknown function (DUF3306)